MDKINMIQTEILAEKEFIFQHEEVIFLILGKKYEKLCDLKRKIITKHLDMEEEIVENDDDVQVICYR